MDLRLIVYGSEVVDSQDGKPMEEKDIHNAYYWHLLGCTIVKPVQIAEKVVQTLDKEVDVYKDDKEHLYAYSFIYCHK